MGSKVKKVDTLPGARYAELYEFARAGMTHAEIARSLRITLPTFRRLMERDPAVKSLMKGSERDRAEDSFQDYLYGCLTDNQKRFWDKINTFWKEDKMFASQKVRALLSMASRQTRMMLFIHALSRSGFNMSKACRKCSLPLSTLNAWKKDPKFQALLDEVEFHRKNFFENAYMTLVRAGNPAAIIHAAKSVLSDRGYGTKVKVETDSDPISNAKVSIEQLDLDLETRKKLYNALVQKKQQALPAHDPDVVEAEVVSVKPAKKGKKK